MSYSRLTQVNFWTELFHILSGHFALLSSIFVPAISRLMHVSKKRLLSANSSILLMPQDGATLDWQMLIAKRSAEEAT